MRNATCRYLSLLILALFLMACEPPSKAQAEWQHAAVGVLAADISNDGRNALVSSVNFGAGFWDLTKNELKFQWQHQQGASGGIAAVAISPDGTRAITAEEQTFVIWNTNTGKAYGYWQAPANIRATALSNKGRYALLGLADGRVIHIDMNTGRRLEFIGHRNEAITSVDLSANGLWAFSGGNDYRAILWNTKTGQPRQIFEHKTRVVQVRLDPNGEQGFTAGTLSNAFVWDLQNGEKLSQLALKPREYLISAARFSHDSLKLVTGAPGRDISLWDVSSGSRLSQWRVRTRKQGKPSGAILYAVAFSADDRFILSESSAGYGELWALDDKQ